MIKGKLKLKIDKDSILQSIDEYQIYKYYLGRDFTIGRNISSPFRNDSTPSFCIYADGEGKLRYIDYGDSRYGGDWVTLVMQLYGLTYRQAIMRVHEDLVLKNPGPIVNKIVNVGLSKKDKLIQIYTGKWNNEELNYWRDYEITEKELKDNKVYPVRQLYIDKVYITNYKQYLRFAYLFGNDGVKVYIPEARPPDNKFLSNVSGTYISGMNTCTGGERVFICSSKKDEMVVKKFEHACSVQSENKKAITKHVAEGLKSFYDKVYVWFDQDKAGHEAAEYYESEYGLIPIYVPIEWGAKDPSDLVKKEGLCKLKEIIENLK